MKSVILSIELWILAILIGKFPCRAAIKYEHKSNVDRSQNEVFKPSTEGKNMRVQSALKDTSVSDHIGVRESWMVDQYGRVRIFHGWNSVWKEPPWYKAEMFNHTKLQLYRDWGFNVVRLGCMWTGFEPEEGRFNETYISIMKDIVKRLATYGIYVIFDMHQDVMSSELGAYDGIPLWILKKFPPFPHPYPWPLKHLLMWSDGYLTQATGLAFQYLYDNYAGTMDSMAKFWGKVAEIFADYDNILGYELINEPWAGDIYTYPWLLEPGNAGRRNLVPSYDKINSEIRKHDKHTLLFYEPVTWGVFLNGEQAGTGFDTVPGGPQYANLSVLSYHYYCWLLSDDHQHRPLSFLEKVICDKIVGPDVFPTVKTNVAKTGGSSFLTEFGQCVPDGDTNSTVTVECDFVLRKCDEYFASWTYWDSQFFDSGGHVNWNATKPFARIYPQAISGIPLLTMYNVTDYSFHFKYTINLEIHQPTEIVIPKLNYPNGFHVNSTRGVKWEFHEQDRLLMIYVNNINFENMSVIEVNITKKI